jgi:hypothetical protein
MTADRVTYGLAYTRNLGNFENVKPFFEISTDVRDGETDEEAKDRIVAKVDKWVEDAVEQIDEEAKK